MTEKQRVRQEVGTNVDEVGDASSLLSSSSSSSDSCAVDPEFHALYRGDDAAPEVAAAEVAAADDVANGNTNQNNRHDGAGRKASCPIDLRQKPPSAAFLAMLARSRTPSPRDDEDSETDVSD